MSAPLPAQPSSPEESYHTQHAPFGAFASFTVGLVDACGGFGQSLRGPANQNVYVGFLPAGQPAWRLLPFFKPPESGESAYTGEEGPRQTPTNISTLRPADYRRTLGWASDTWQADDGRFAFSLLTPFAAVPDPARMSKDAARRRLPADRTRLFCACRRPTVSPLGFLIPGL
jgi:hypothetical protein